MQESRQSIRASPSTSEVQSWLHDATASLQSFGVHQPSPSPSTQLAAQWGFVSLQSPQTCPGSSTQPPLQIARPSPSRSGQPVSMVIVILEGKLIDHQPNTTYGTPGVRPPTRRDADTGLVPSWIWPIDRPPPVRSRSS